jgi:hypothetical protein
MSPQPHAPHDWKVMLEFDKNNKLINIFDEKGNKLTMEKMSPHAKLEKKGTITIANPEADPGGGGCPPGYCSKTIGNMKTCVPC